MQRSARWIIGGLALALLMTMGGNADARRRFARRARAARPVAAAPAPRATAALPAAETPVAKNADVSDGPAVRIDPRQAMADILALRAAQGGSDATGDAEFADALQRLIAEKHGEVLEIPGLAPVESHLPAAAPALPSFESVLMLRAAAVHFDARAAELEAQKAYQEADAARATAAALRAEARRLDP